MVDNKEDLDYESVDAYSGSFEKKVQKTEEAAE